MELYSIASYLTWLQPSTTKPQWVAIIFEIGSHFSKYQMWQFGQFSKIRSQIFGDLL